MTADEIVEALEPTGMCEVDMIATATHLLRADELGIHDQGTLRVPWLAKMRFPAFPFEPQIRCEKLPYTENTWRITGKHRIGYSLMQAATKYPYVDKRWVAPQLVVVDGCFPSGALGIWARDFADRGLASLMTATSKRRVQHPLGAGPMIGTTPVSVCIPDPYGEHLVADLALTEATFGDVLSGVATDDEMRFRDMRMWALGISLETMVRTMSFEQSAVLMFLFRPINQTAVEAERRRSVRRLPGERLAVPEDDQ